jgi:hypothetical protein
MRANLTSVLALSTWIVLAGLLVGCRGMTSSPTPSPVPLASPTAAPLATPTPAAAVTPPTAEATATPAAELVVSVYFARGERLGVVRRAIPRTPQVGAAALAELLAGPSVEERSIGFSSEIPPGTRLLGLSVQDGVATVDLSGQFGQGGGSLSMMTRVAQVVFTLTQFPSVQAVQFRLDGQPVEALGGEGLLLDRPLARDDFEQVLPAIFVESPAPFDVVTPPIRLWGTANTFEATFMVRLTDATGTVLVEQYAMATSGSGTRGTFDVTLEVLPRQAGPATLTVYEVSAADGSPVNVVELPIVLAD